MGFCLQVRVRLFSDSIWPHVRQLIGPHRLIQWMQLCECLDALQLHGRRLHHSRVRHWWHHQGIQLLLIVRRHIKRSMVSVRLVSTPMYNQLPMQVPISMQATAKKNQMLSLNHNKIRKKHHLIYHQKWVVPWNNLANNSDWLLVCHCKATTI